MLFTLADIQSCFHKKSFDKGKLLFEQNGVVNLNVAQGGELLTAVIKIPEFQSSRVYVRLQKTPHALTILGECSCDVRQNCEHVVAVLLKRLFDEKLLPEAFEASTSSSTEKQTSVPALAVSAHNTQQLVYILIPQHQSSDMLVKSGVVRLKPTTQTLDTNSEEIKYFAPSFASRTTPARFLTSDDIKLLNILNGFEKDKRTGFPKLTKNSPAQLFFDLLETKRCYYFGSDKRPLSFSDSRQLALRWKMDRHASQHLKWEVSPVSDVLFLSQACYIDTETGQSGLLVAKDTQGRTMPDSLICEMLRAAPLAAEQRDDQADWSMRYADIQIPGLKVADIQRITALAPIPCLQLCSFIEPTKNQPRDAVCFSVSYGDIGLKRNDPPYYFDGKQVYCVERNEVKENAFVDQLLALGLVKDKNSHFHSESDFFTLNQAGDTALKWLDFQFDKLPQLREEGWRITLSNDFRFPAVQATQWHCHVSGEKNYDWFDFEIGVEINGEKVDLIPALIELMKEYPDGLTETENLPAEFTLSLLDGRILKVSTDRLRSIFNLLLEFYDEETFSDDDVVRIPRVQLSRLTELGNLDQNVLEFDAEDDILQLLKQLKNIKDIPPVIVPARLNAELRVYQQQGYEWLQFLREYQFSGVLADEMGLGKTLQTLAHIQKEKEQGRLDKPVLIVMPTSLIFNWRQEAERFTPDLTVLSLHGQQRHDLFKSINQYDLVLTTYPLLHRDEEQLLKFDYHMLILDEAQLIKNSSTKASQTVRKITARHRLCLTGTPMENHLGELWSLFDFLMPGFLGDKKYFQRNYRTAIEKNGDEEASAKLSQLIRPFLLRRTKEAVSPELPNKTEVTIKVVLESEQRDHYESVRLAMHQYVKKEIKRLGIARCQFLVLNALLKLRQICCDPRLLKAENEAKSNENKSNKAKPYEGGSAKLELLMGMLVEMIAEGRRILLFSQFTSMLQLIEERLIAENMDYLKLTGKTPDREWVVSQFQNRKKPLLLISLKAGGVGLNLTEADTVIHYDPWWNPAVEQQATARAHRIGQQNPVFIYKLICQDSVEEKMLQMQGDKLTLINALYSKGGGSKPQWDQNDVEELFGV